MYPMEKDDRETVHISLSDSADAGQLFGIHDANLKRIEEVFGADIVMRRDELLVTGKMVEKAAGAIEDLIWLLENNETVDEQKLEYVIYLNESGSSYRANGANNDIIAFTHKGKPIKAKTLGQKSYIEAIRAHDIVFSIGPAGTGKTYLAVAAAVSAFRGKLVNRIILTRPAVEAGERLGFLPGDMQSKVDPYLRPLYDALFELLGADTYAKYLERGNIEVAPLAYMRGRTLDDSFIILDEAQNTSREQMKMFLTRLGFGSKMVITGDITQIDLPPDKTSGLRDALRVLEGIPDIAVSYLTSADVVRHELVSKIIEAYDKRDKKPRETPKPVNKSRRK